MGERTEAGRAAARWIAVLMAPAIAVPLVAGLAACGPKVTAEYADSSDSATDETPEQEPAEEEPLDELPASEDLPADWPADILVPDGAIVLVLEVGSGYVMTVEGVDDEQARGLIAEMAGAGLETMGPTDDGIGGWTASATSATHIATYAYATGGAGLPNVGINLMPVG